MEFFKNIKWYHIIIICLIIILIFLIFTNNNCNFKMNQNALVNQEGFDSEKKNDFMNNKIILYYATWCGHSISFLPEWERFETYAKNNLPDIFVNKIKCEENNKILCNQKGIKGFPTVILYNKKGEEIIFNDDRKMQNLIDFIKKHT